MVRISGFTMRTDDDMTIVMMVMMRYSTYRYICTLNLYSSFFTSFFFLSYTYLPPQCLLDHRAVQFKTYETVLVVSCTPSSWAGSRHICFMHPSGCGRERHWHWPACRKLSMQLVYIYNLRDAVFFASAQPHRRWCEEHFG